MSRLSRRNFLIGSNAALALAQPNRPALDRLAIVTRHNPTLSGNDPNSPLSVGNGEFAFTADCTSLQTFPELYEKTVPLCTQAQWGWHSFPLPAGTDPKQLRLEKFETYGRQVGYPASAKGQEPLFNWLRENPHRLNLARIGLLLDGKRPTPSDLGRVEQKLNLGDGVMQSRFELRGTTVSVRTCCHPTIDALAISVRSPLLRDGKVSVVIEFPYGSPEMNASDWNAPTRHTTVAKAAERSVEISRTLDDDHYNVTLAWDGPAHASLERHRVVMSTGNDSLDFVCQFSHGSQAATPLTAGAVREASTTHWARFWSTGAAIDLAGVQDRRAQELERRIVLSQYLTAIQCSGSAPPQETGLTCNSWFGKFHLEMHWWHAAHFALWGRTPMLERSMAWYSAILKSAQEKASSQGYKGARWPKMTALDGRDSPSAIGPLLIWQQPHPIAMAELCYQTHPNRETLQRYQEIVSESAEFMASFAVLRDNRYVLGPPVIPAQENHPPRETWNPTFELTYWREALVVAQQWRERAGLDRKPEWDDVRTRLAKLPAKDGVYLAHENCPQTFTERNRDHPSMLAALGVLRGLEVDKETMRRTLKKVFAEWRWPDTWGWDFPMVAMTAARLNEPELAIDALFIESPKNTWRANGHNWQRQNLPLYLPGNGGLLAAIALMANTTGFPKSWRIRHEGFRPLL